MSNCRETGLSFDLRRRRLLRSIAGAAGALLLPARTIAQSAPPESADAIRQRLTAALESVLADPEIVASARASRERWYARQPGIDELIAGLQKRLPPSKTQISKLAVDTIVQLEVSDEKTYTRQYQGVEVPGSYSGVTIGIGYDIGQITRDFFKEDWQGLIPDELIDRLSAACGKIKAAAKEIAQSLEDVKITWQVAIDQFTNRTLPLYVADTESAFKNTGKLHPDSLGALVSLIYNRGTAFSGSNANGEDTRSEMRNIREMMEQGRFGEIPDQFRAMKWIWDQDHGNYSRGLLIRRDIEADLFAHGLAQTS
jgi:GH24 family phage-related lysozyme (muramidase)